MKEFKGTPGPWLSLPAEQPVNQYSYVINSRSGCIGYWKGHKDWHDDSSWVLTEHDASLIAAAPDLLEALQKLVVEMEITLRVGYERIIDLGGSCDEPQAMIDGHHEIARAKAAIAKALGETK
jgi:hypothetical protein